MLKRHNLIIIGGGQAGLAAGYYAKQNHVDYLILDAAEATGDSWRERYDSLKLFTPRAYSSLSGLKIEGDANSYPGKDDIADYLAYYARRFELNILHGQKVTRLTKHEDTFTVSTVHDNYTANAVIIAIGSFHKPLIPPWVQSVQGLTQIHSSAYRNPTQVRGKKVLVIGGGNSGSQISEELIRSGFDVSMSVSGKMKFIPAKILGKSFFWWLDKSGFLNASKDSIRGKLLHRRGDPIIGTDFRRLIRRGKVNILPHATGMEDKEIIFAGSNREIFDTIIWCTGYAIDYGFIDIPEALDLSGNPIQEKGISKVVDRLSYLGLIWMRSRNSALLDGASADARHVVTELFAKH